MENVFNIYSIKDNVAEQFGPLFEAVNDKVAARSFVQQMSKIDKRYVKDYTLYNLGSYNTKSGELMQDHLPVSVYIYDVSDGYVKSKEEATNKEARDE